MHIVDVDVNLNVNPTVDVVVDTTGEPSVNSVLASGSATRGSRREPRFECDAIAPTTRPSTSRSTVAFTFTFRSRST